MFLSISVIGNVIVSIFISFLPLTPQIGSYKKKNVGIMLLAPTVRGLRIAILASSAFGVLMFFAAFFRGDLLCGIFARDAAVVAAGTDYLRAYAIDCLLTCFLFCFIGYFNGLGETGFVMLQGIAAAFLIRIPVAWWMSRVSGRLFYIGLGVPLSTVAQILACFGYLAWLKKRERG